MYHLTSSLHKPASMVPLVDENRAFYKCNVGSHHHTTAPIVSPDVYTPAFHRQTFREHTSPEHDIQAIALREKKNKNTERYLPNSNSNITFTTSGGKSSAAQSRDSQDRLQRLGEARNKEE